MTPEEARKLKPGDRIRWRDGTLGKVETADKLMVLIRWDDGPAGEFVFDDASIEFKGVERA